MATAVDRKRPARSATTRGAAIVFAQALDEVDRLEAAWHALDACGGSPASHFGWTRACLTAFTEDAAAELVATMQGGRLLGVAPLVRKRRHGVHRLFLAGESQLREPMDLVWADDAALSRMTLALARGGTPLLFERIPADSPSIAALKRAYRGRALVVVRPAAPYPYILLDESWLEPERHLNPYCRDELRRARLKAERLGPVATEIHAPGLHELPALVDAAIEVEARDRRCTAARRLADDPHRAVFFRQFCEAACVDGTLRICLLRIGDRVAAVQVGIESGDAFWLLLAGEDERFAACSSGQLLARETIRYAAEAELRSFQFWGRPLAWTPAWTALRRECVSLRAYPFGLRGLAALVADAAVAGCRAWRES